MSNCGYEQSRPFNTATPLAPLQAPAETAVAAGRRRGAGEETFAEALVFGPVPYLAETALGGVAQGEAAIALHTERRDAAGQNASVGGDVHQRPRATT